MYCEKVVHRLIYKLDIFEFFGGGVDNIEVDDMRVPS